eukprot:gene26919-33567_t
MGVNQKSTLQTVKQPALPFSQLCEHQASDECSLNFTECPLFSIGMCDSDCSGRLRIDALAMHVSTDLALMTSLVSTIKDLRRQLVTTPSITNGTDSHKRQRCRV